MTSVAGAVQAGCLAILARTRCHHLVWVFALSLGLGCVQAFDRPAAQAFIAELVPREAIPSAVGLASAAQSVGGASVILIGRR